MMKNFLIFCLIFTSMNLQAAEWALIHTHKNGVRLFSSESYELEDGTIRTFLKTVKGKNSSKPFAILINCKSRMGRNYVAGDLGAEFFIPWEPITPDSVGEQAYNSFCAGVLKKLEDENKEKISQEKSQIETETARKLELEKNGFTLTKKEDASYTSRLRSQIRPDISFSEIELKTVKGNPETVVELAFRPNGEILGLKLTLSSGYPAWDEAVMKGVKRVDRLPRDIYGNMPEKVLLSFRPWDPF